MDFDENTIYIEILIVTIRKTKSHLNKMFAINNLICGRLQLTVVTTELTLTVWQLSELLKSYKIMWATIYCAFMNAKPARLFLVIHYKRNGEGKIINVRQSNFYRQTDRLPVVKVTVFSSSLLPVHEYSNHLLNLVCLISLHYWLYECVYMCSFTVHD